jgi:hypothetical protein
MKTEVINLKTLEKRIYSLPPRDAAIAAYAQERGDYNTWDYEARYGHLITEGFITVACGDWCAMKGGTL